MKKELTLGILITTMNDGIERVKSELLPQLQKVDEIIISHQITDQTTKPEGQGLGKNVKYFFMYDKGLSKNRNNALKHSTADICHICDDDLDYIKGFEKVIKDKYIKGNYNIITFQAEDYTGNKHFKISEGKHNIISLLKVHSLVITFNRKKIIDKGISFDEQFGLGSKFPVGEENIFLTDCYRQKLEAYHYDNTIVKHQEESSGKDYREKLIIARVNVFKRIFGKIVAFLFIFYFTIFHYQLYKQKFSILSFLTLSLKAWYK